MINKIQVIIIILSLIDLTATYFYVLTFHVKFPKLDYTTLEANPILRMSWKLWGLNTGMIIGGLIVFALLILVTLTITEKWQYFLLGILVMMNVYHILNFAQLAALKPAA